MNREMKFRAWDKKGDGMFYNIQDGVKFDDGSRYSFDRFLHKTEDDFHEWEITQYTGFKDKKGNEIYEGDILTRKILDVEAEPYFWVCEYDKLNGGYRFVYQGDKSVHGMNYCDEMKIIGTIYENPELLK